MGRSEAAGKSEISFMKDKKKNKGQKAYQDNIEIEENAAQNNEEKIGYSVGKTKVLPGKERNENLIINAEKSRIETAEGQDGDSDNSATAFFEKENKSI